MATLQIKGSGGIQIVLDEIMQPLVDSVDLVNSASDVAQSGSATIVAASGLSVASYLFFSAPAGKPLSQANVPGNGQGLPYLNSFEIHGIDFRGQGFYVGNKLGLLPIIAEKSSLTLKIGTKNYLEVCTREVAGGVWQNAAVATTATTTTDDYRLQSFGPPIARGMMFDRGHYQTIAQTQNFSVLWQMEALASGEQTQTTVASGSPVRLQVALYGYLRRPAQ